MVNVRQNNSPTVNIHVQNSSSQTSTSNIRMYDNTDFLAAGLAKDWAIRTDGKVENIDYSSKYYAQRAKQSENLTREYMEETISAIETRVPVATASVLGGIKVGSNLSVTSDGTLSGLLTAAWGNISGTLSSQSDLQSALNSKTDLSLGNISSEGLDKLIQSNALKTGSISDNSSVLSWLNEIKYSTFDLSRFTKVGSPTITNDGIASGFSTSNFIGTGINSSNFTQSFEIHFQFNCTDVVTRQAIFGLSTAYGLHVDVDAGKIKFGASSNGTSQDIANNVVSTLSVNANQSYVGRLTWNGSTYKVDLLINNQWVNYISVSSSLPIITGYYVRIGIVNNVLPLTCGSVDLKRFSIKANGVPIFDGNVTGTDTYSISGSTVIVPYTLSKTGSKFVDSAYRTQVASVYDYQGYAPYYTLSDTDFTLPQGEVYGMIEHYLNIDYPTQNEKDTITGWGMPKYSDGISVSANSNYTAPSSGFVNFVPVDNTSTNGTVNIGSELTGYISIAGKTILQSTYASGHDSSHPDSAFFLISKGEVLYHTMSAGTVYFYPAKGAN